MKSAMRFDRAFFKTIYILLRFLQIRSMCCLLRFLFRREITRTAARLCEMDGTLSLSLPRFREFVAQPPCVQFS